MPGTVGVAPGTITLQLNQFGLGGTVVCPPDEPWQYITPPTYATMVADPTWDSRYRPTPAGAQVAFEPYGTESTLKGLWPQVDPQKTRWDIVAAVGLGTFGVALILGLIATR